MLDIAKEEAYLALADRHIAEAEERIRIQRHRIELLEAKGNDTLKEHELLSLALDFLRMTKLHRTLILARLGREV